MSEIIPGALGIASHREGVDTLALGDYSHSEGDKTQAQGKSSHAEGTSTASIGDSSHAEGLGTISKNDNQHVQGSYNVGLSDDTIHEVGIGIDDLNRKNAFEVFVDGQVKVPEQTFTDQFNGDGTNVSTVEYSHRKEYSIVKVADGTEMTLDIKREINFIINISNDLKLKRPINMVSGQSGSIILNNVTTDDITLSFDDYWVSSNVNVKTFTSDYGVMILEYKVIDENNIYYNLGNEFTTHLPIQLGSGNYLTINANGDPLLT